MKKNVFIIAVVAIVILLLSINSSVSRDWMKNTFFSAKEETVSSTVGDEPFNNTEYLGYELLDNNSVLHIWNTQNDYYFNTSSGIQFSNHYEEYWTHNVMMLGYYDGDEWNLIYRTDELSGFNRNITGTTNDTINATIWKDLSYGAYDFRLALRYHLGVNDSDLTVIPYIKNLGIAIPFQIGFGWEMKDIKIANVSNDNYLRIYNGTDECSYCGIFENILLNQTLDRNFTDMGLNTTIRFVCTNPPNPFFSRDLYLSWNPNLTYKVTCKSRSNQYNAPVTLFIKVGTLAVDQEKSTEMHWLDADDWLGISSAELDSFCGECASFPLSEALDGTNLWNHDVYETHWFVIDLGATYIIKKVRGRSDTSIDPTDVNIYIDDNNPPTTLVHEGITTWQDTTEWVEVDITDSDGRYIKVEIEATEWGVADDILWGKATPFMTIFDAYGDVAGPPPNNAPTQSGEVPANSSTGISLTPDLYVNCSDTNGDNLNATWWSNSSGAWVQFASNWTSFASGTNITQNFPNASAYSTTYWWSVNLSDGTDWDNETYHFTTESANNLPELISPSVSPTSGVDSYTTFYFNVTWADQDGEDPTDGYLKVNITRSGWNTNQSMTWISGSNTTGAIYSYSAMLTAGSYNYTFFAYDGTDYNSSGPHDDPTVSAQSISFNIGTSSPSGDFEFKNWTLTETGVGYTTEYNVSEDNQTAGTSACQITNTGNVPINISIMWLSNPGSGITMKWADSNTPPNPGDADISVSPTETQIITNLDLSDTENIWLWMDFISIGAQDTNADIGFTSELYL